MCNLNICGVLCRKKDPENFLGVFLCSELDLKRLCLFMYKKPGGTFQLLVALTHTLTTQELSPH